MDRSEELESIIKIEPDRFQDENYSDCSITISPIFNTPTAGLNHDEPLNSTKTKDAVGMSHGFVMLSQNSFRCISCEKVMNDFSSICEHIRMHTECSFKCDLCPEVFSLESLLTRHKHENHLKRKEYSCTLCDFKTYIESLAIRHATKREKCNVCTKLVCCTKMHERDCHSNKREVKVRVKRVRRDVKTKVACPTCGKLISSNTALKNHIRDLHEKTKKCDQCDAVVQFHQMRSHVLKHHYEGELFSCHCGEVFKSKMYLRLHKLSHDDSTISCQICNRTLKSKSSLKSHWLKKHYKTHGTIPNWRKYLEGVKNGDLTEVPKDLGTNKNIVINRGPLTCDVCGHISKARQRFYIHFKNLHSGKLFHCDLCPHSSYMKYNLGKHMRAVHLKSRPFICQICNHRTFTEFNLNKHMMTHRSKRKCKICDKMVTDLEAHLKNVHLRKKGK